MTTPVWTCSLFPELKNKRLTIKRWAIRRVRQHLLRFSLRDETGENVSDLQLKPETSVSFEPVSMRRKARSAVRTRHLPVTVLLTKTQYYSLDLHRRSTNLQDVWSALILTLGNGQCWTLEKRLMLIKRRRWTRVSVKRSGDLSGTERSLSARGLARLSDTPHCGHKSKLYSESKQ